MSNSATKRQNIELLEVKKGKFYIKLKNIDFPVAVNEYLYKRWVQQNNEMNQNGEISSNDGELVA